LEARRGSAGEGQMALVDGIESTAKDRESQGAHRVR
jgi:hypothetical protein